MRDIFCSKREREKKPNAAIFVCTNGGGVRAKIYLERSQLCLCEFFFNTERLLGGNIKAHVNITPRDTQYVV